MKNTEVGISGMGLVCCLGAGVQAVFRRMCAGECGIRAIDRFPASDYAQASAGQIPATLEAALRDEFPEDDIAEAMVKAAGREALNQAGSSTDTAPDERLGLILATNFGLMETLEWCWRERIDLGSMDRETFARLDAFPADTAAWFGCGGPRAQLSLSCASGAAAVALGKAWIDTGRADRVLAVGYDALTEFCWSGLTSLHTISTDALRPFDARRSGTIFGEGAAAMLLERRTNHENTEFLAQVAGAATNNNAFHMTAPAKQGDGSRRVMAAAMRDAGIATEDVDHICAHATATVPNDVTETAAFRSLFQAQLDQVTVAAHKSQLAHMMGAAGMAEAIVTVEVIRNGLVPPTVNHEVMDPECAVDCVAREARRRPVGCAVTNSAGIGGNNAALVLTSADR